MLESGTDPDSYITELKYTKNFSNLRGCAAGVPEAARDAAAGDGARAVFRLLSTRNPGPWNLNAEPLDP